MLGSCVAGASALARPENDETSGRNPVFPLYVVNSTANAGSWRGTCNPIGADDYGYRSREN
jgi:hypothetical protein